MTQGALDRGTNLEGKVLRSCWRHGDDRLNDLHTVDLASLADKLLGIALDCLCLETLNLLFHRVVLLNVLADDALQVLGIVEECLHCLQRVLDVVEQLLALFSCAGLDTTDASCYTALRDDLEETDATC